MKTASALQFHILFFVLCGFPLRLLLPLSRIVLQSLGYGVLRFGLLLNRLFRRKDFADPIANILHRLQFLSDGGKLPGKLEHQVHRPGHRSGDGHGGQRLGQIQRLSAELHERGRPHHQREQGRDADGRERRRRKAELHPRRRGWQWRSHRN